MSEAAAQAAALTELGDAWTAARRFRKQHLTEGEARDVESMVGNARSVFILGLLYLAFASFACLTSIDQGVTYHHLALVFVRVTYRHLALDLAVMFLVWVALPTASFFLARRKNTKLNLPLLILIQSVSGFWFGNALILNMEIQQSAGFWLQVFAWAWPVSLFLNRVGIWRKLRKKGYFLDEAPPRDTAIS